jgi:hypothetical protein
MFAAHHFKLSESEAWQWQIIFISGSVHWLKIYGGHGTRK